MITDGGTAVNVIPETAVCRFYVRSAERGYKTVILDYIAEKYPGLESLYDGIYKNGDRGYWAALDEEMRKFMS